MSTPSPFESAEPVEASPAVATAEPVDEVETPADQGVARVEAAEQNSHLGIAIAIVFFVGAAIALALWKLF